MSLFSGMSADKSADASADALCIIILGLVMVSDHVGHFGPLVAILDFAGGAAWKL